MTMQYICNMGSNDDTSPCLFQPVTATCAEQVSKAAEIRLVLKQPVQLLTAQCCAVPSYRLPPPYPCSIAVRVQGLVAMHGSALHNIGASAEINRIRGVCGVMLSHPAAASSLLSLATIMAVEGYCCGC